MYFKFNNNVLVLGTFTLFVFIYWLVFAQCGDLDQFLGRKRFLLSVT